MILISKKYIFECTECGNSYFTLGGLHSHAEKHTSFSLTPNVDDLNSLTRVLKITETEEVDLEEVQGVPSRNGFIDYFTGIVGLKS